MLSGDVLMRWGFEYDIYITVTSGFRGYKRMNTRGKGDSSSEILGVELIGLN